MSAKEHEEGATADSSDTLTCSAQVLEIENKNEKVVAFAWEPKGHRFALIHGEGPRPDVSIYSMKSKTGQDKLTLLTTLKAKQANALYWSPQVRIARSVRTRAGAATRKSV